MFSTDGEGLVVFDPISSSRFTGGELSGDVQDAINRKTVKRQMDDAPDLKWLAVMVEGSAALMLTAYPDHEQSTE